MRDGAMLSVQGLIINCIFDHRVLRKYTSISFIFVAYSLLLLHSVIPHHHTHETEQVTAHQDSNDHDGDTEDHNDNNNDFLPHAFAHFLHDEGAIIIYTQYLINPDCSLISGLTNFTTSLAYFIIKAIHPPPLIPVFSPPLFCTNTHLPASDPLRGPPAFLSA